MKKIFYITLLSFIFINTANADTIIILDENNNFKQQIYTGNAQNLPQTTISTQNLPTQQINISYHNTLPLIREQHIIRKPHPNYIISSTIAGFTGALLGNIIFDHKQHFRHRKHRRHHKHL